MTGPGFCPQCGTQRQGSLRFCASCGFDFWKAAQAQSEGAPPPATSAPPTQAPAVTAAEPSAKPARSRWLPWIGAAVAALLVVGVINAVFGGDNNGGVGGDGSPTPTVAASTDNPTPEPEAETPEPATARPTPDSTPQSETGVYREGETVQLTQDGSDWANITLGDVREDAFYPDPSGYFDDEPQTPGNVFIAARVRYKALTNGVDYNPFDWSVFVGDQAVDDFTFVTNGPKPKLSSGTLPKGKKAEGWVIYEVPPKGRVELVYQDNFFTDRPPVFLFVVRTK